MANIRKRESTAEASGANLPRAAADPIASRNALHRLAEVAEALKQESARAELLELRKGAG